MAHVASASLESEEHKVDPTLHARCEVFLPLFLTVLLHNIHNSVNRSFAVFNRGWNVTSLHFILILVRFEQMLRIQAHLQIFLGKRASCCFSDGSKAPKFSPLCFICHHNSTYSHDTSYLQHQHQPLSRTTTTHHQPPSRTTTTHHQPFF